MNTYTKGSLPNLRGEFRDPDAGNLTADELALGGRLFDPAGQIHFKLIKPDASNVVYIYGVNAELLRDNVGKYRVQYQLTQEGDYWYRFESDVQIAVGEKTIRVADTPF